MIMFACLVYACPREHDYFGTTVARGTAQSAGAVRVRVYLLSLNFEITRRVCLYFLECCALLASRARQTPRKIKKILYILPSTRSLVVQVLYPYYAITLLMNLGTEFCLNCSHSKIKNNSGVSSTLPSFYNTHIQYSYEDESCFSPS